MIQHELTTELHIQPTFKAARTRSLFAAKEPGKVKYDRNYDYYIFVGYDFFFRVCPAKWASRTLLVPKQEQEAFLLNARQSKHQHR
jgi:hypothetical protein